MRSCIYFLLAFFLLSCGFKARPLVPKAKELSTLPLKYCSPYHPKCSLRYADYIPGLDPNNPQHQKKIRRIEASHKLLFEREQKNRQKKDRVLPE